MNRVIMFDVDGVLADFLAAYRRVEESLDQQPTFEARWDAYLNTNIWAYIKRSPAFWTTIPPLASAYTFARINVLTYQYDVYFVTNRPGVTAKGQTERWLRERGVVNPTVIISARKGDIAAALGAHFAIDDKAGNAIATSYISPKTKSYLLDAPYNQFDHAVVGGSVTRVKTLDQFLDAVVCEEAQ